MDDSMKLAHSEREHNCPTVAQGTKSCARAVVSNFECLDMALWTRQSPYSLPAAALVFEFLLMLSFCARGAHYFLGQPGVNSSPAAGSTRTACALISPALYVLSDVLESVSDPASSIRHELRIRPFFEDDVSAFPGFVIDQAPFVA
jgi:hypothetical protein